MTQARSVEASMEEVLRAEREAEEAIARCRRQAEAIEEEGRARARNIARRADERMGMVRRRCAERAQARIARLQRRAEAEKLPVVPTARDHEHLRAAVERLAERLTGDADERAG